MEQTHLISVCVFCLLCATHIHCSEYSSRAVKSKIKSKGDNVNMEKQVRGQSLIESSLIKRSKANGLLYTSLPEKMAEITKSEEQFLNTTQRSPDPVNIMYNREGDSNCTGEFGSAHPVLNRVASSRNGTRSVNKYIKIPESVRIIEVREVKGEVRTLDTRRGKREIVGDYRPVLNEHLYIENLFKKYRNSDNRIDLNGFKAMLTHLGLNRFALLEDEDPDRERINSLELRESDSRIPGNRTSRRDECISPGNLLRTVVREMENGNASGEVAHGEKRRDEEGGEKGEGFLSFNAGDTYLSESGLLKLCPFLLYQLVQPEPCLSAHHHRHEQEIDGNQHLLAWLYATASVVIVSLCGLLGVFVIPIMGHAFYQQLLQFLVALAVGTLCGDALLHLLPHAMIPHNDEAHDGESHDHDHTSTMWKGLAVLLGIVFFFFTEKCLTLASEWRKKHQRNKKVQGHSHVQILNGNNQSDSVGEKLCKHKYSSYPYCYPDIKSNKDGHEHSKKHVIDSSNHNSVEDRVLVPKWHNDAKDAAENQRLTHLHDQREEEKQISTVEEHMTVGEEKSEEEEVSCGRKDGEYTVIIREHESIHHGHSHAHGHVHSPPESLSSVAWMVILGDGLHNFTDGMAIGAAFANNIAGGFSTAVAVFCHELPHELGDFAVLIKAGMSAKQAVFYNLISSILCFFGMCLGIFVGDNPQATSWVFAVSAGMFLYIGLVDMPFPASLGWCGFSNGYLVHFLPVLVFSRAFPRLPSSLGEWKRVLASSSAFILPSGDREYSFPELTSSHSAKESSLCQCSLQGLGLIAGVSIMLLIAFYEDQLLTLFN